MLSRNQNLNVGFMQPMNRLCKLASGTLWIIKVVTQHLKVISSKQKLLRTFQVYFPTVNCGEGLDGRYFETSGGLNRLKKIWIPIFWCATDLVQINSYLNIGVKRLEVPRQQHHGQLENLISHLHEKHVPMKAPHDAVAQSRSDLQLEPLVLPVDVIGVNDRVTQRLLLELGRDLLETYFKVDGEIKPLQVVL